MKIPKKIADIKEISKQYCNNNYNIVYLDKTKLKIYKL